MKIYAVVYVHAAWNIELLGVNFSLRYTADIAILSILSTVGDITLGALHAAFPALSVSYYKYLPRK